MVKIIQIGNKILRQTAESVSVLDITKPKIQKVLKNLSSALNSQDDAVAVAAPQIAVSLRIFAVSGKIFRQDNLNTNNNSAIPMIHPDLFFINPIIIKKSRINKVIEEGCLSVRGVYGNVRRAVEVMIEAYNEKGEKFTMRASDLLAAIFQHEIDHLNGILFVDKAKDLRKIL